MCKHSRSSPFVRLSHCASVLATGLYSACTGLHLVDEAPPDYCSAQRTPPHRPTLAFLPENAQYPADVEPITTEEDPSGAMKALSTLSEADAEDDHPSDTSTIKPQTQYDVPFDANEALPATICALPAYEEPPTTEPLSLTEAPPVPAPTSSNPSAEEPLRTPTATDRLHATTIRWQQENAARRAREEKEARKPWVARKVRRGVEKARETRRGWMRAVSERREGLWWDWQVWLVE